MKNTPEANRTPILILGDAGPSCYALLARQDIEAYWTNSLTGALANLRKNKPKACIIHPSDCQDGVESFVAACSREGSPPCIVVLRADEWSEHSHWISVGASEVVQIELTQAIMQLLGNYTGLQFAQAERAPLEMPIDIHHEGATQTLKTSDVSASGVGICGLAATVGDLVQAHMKIGDNSMALWSRVVRVWHSAAGESMAGIRFIGLTASQTEQLRDFVREENAKHQPIEVNLSNLFDGIKSIAPPLTLAPDDFGAAGDRNDQWIMEASQNLHALEAHADEPDSTLAPFLVQLYVSLSEIEVQALKTRGDPEWVYQIVHTLVCIESWHNNNPAETLPKTLYDRANAQFLSLASHEAEGEEIAVQVSIMRAHLLRYLLADNDISRN